MKRAALVISLLGLAACDRPLIEGIVVNVQGERLPGVAVRVAGTDYNALTNALGEYKIAYSPGDVRLEYFKSGYTAEAQGLKIAERAPVAAEPVQMWRLPAAAGVYLFEDFRYKDVTRVEPKRYYLEDGEAVYGTERAPLLRTDNLSPEIVAYNLPRYDARISRLIETPAKRTAVTEDVTSIWAEAGTTRPQVSPVTEDDADLLRIVLDDALEPGVYAVHWGALDGYAILDSRIHMFRVGPAPVEESGEGEGESEGEGEGSSERKEVEGTIDG